MRYEYDYQGIGAVLRGRQIAAATRAAAERAKVLYQATVVHRTGRLAASATVSMSTGSNGRPVATLAVGGPTAAYGLAHEYGDRDEPQHHDLLTVLGMLR